MDFDAARESARERDAADPLASLRDRFSIPGLYMDGNSLGALSDSASDAVDHVVDEWRRLGVRGWTDADPPWFTYGERLGDRIAPLVGAHTGEVVVANSTTVNIHTLVGTFYDPDRGGHVVVDALDFPTDHYAIRAQLREKGRDPDDALRVVDSRDGRTIAERDVVAAIDDDVSLVFLPSVLYRSGQLLDLEPLVEAAHAHDALVGVDLAHSVGVVPHELSAVGVDVAVWCSYKYLNGGPGALAGLYVNERHHGRTPALTGWWGHDKETQFDMALDYTPAADAGAYQLGTPPILSAAALDGALDIFDETDMDDVREKSLALTAFLVDLVDGEALADCEVGTPRDPDRRGGHVAIEHPEAHRLSLALKARDVVVDYRPPNVVRVCPAPLYTRFEDVLEVARHLRVVLDGREYERFDARGDGVT